MGDWRYAGAVVEAEFRDFHVPLHPGACYEAEGMQEVVFHPTSETE